MNSAYVINIPVDTCETTWGTIHFSFVIVMDSEPDKKDVMNSIRSLHIEEVQPYTAEHILERMVNRGYACDKLPLGSITG